MILQQDKSFSNQLISSLKIYNHKMCTVSKNRKRPTSFDISHGAFSLLENERFVDLSENQLYNPLGHSHPIYSTGLKEESCIYQEDLVVTKPSGPPMISDFLVEEEAFQEAIKFPFPGLTINNFHNLSFSLRKTSVSEAHPQANLIIKLLKYYRDLRIFHPEGVFSKINEILVKNAIPELVQVNGIRLTIHSPSKDLEQRLLDFGILTSLEKTRSLYFPLSLTPTLTQEIITRVNEALCSF